MAMAWLIHYMEESIGESYLFHSIAKQNRNVVTLTYSDLEDFSSVFELRNRIKDSKKGDTTVAQVLTNSRNSGKSWIYLIE